MRRVHDVMKKGLWGSVRRNGLKKATVCVFVLFRLRSEYPRACFGQHVSKTFVGMTDDGLHFSEVGITMTFESTQYTN